MLSGHGVEFTEPTAYWAGGPRTWHLFKGGYGGAMMRVLVNKAVELGAEIYYESTVKKLLRDQDGPDTGVIVENTTGN